MSRAAARARKEAWRFAMIPQLAVWVHDAAPSTFLVMGDVGEYAILPFEVDATKHDINDGHHRHPIVPSGSFEDAVTAMRAAEAMAAEAFPSVGFDWMFVSGLLRSRTLGRRRWSVVLACIPGTAVWNAFVLLGTVDVPVLSNHRHETLGAFDSWQAAVVAADAYQPPVEDAAACDCGAASWKGPETVDGSWDTEAP